MRCRWGLRLRRICGSSRMTAQLACTLAASAIGFISAVLFCVGNASNCASSIFRQARPMWDFHEPLARSLALQRSQYIVGAAFLVLAFVLQLAAALVSAASPATVPNWLSAWPIFIFSVLVLGGAVATAAVVAVYRVTMREVLALDARATEASNRQQLLTLVTSPTSFVGGILRYVLSI